ncbi:MAG: hypothetical protein AAGG44_06110 [Planctomycetota bacterium]
MSKANSSITALLATLLLGWILVGMPFLDRVHPPGLGSSLAAQDTTSDLAPGSSSTSGPTGISDQQGEPIPLRQDPSELAIRILNLALFNSVWGESARCEVRQKIEIYDQTVSSFGAYVRGGKGSGRLYLSLQFPAGDSINSVVQISDGQILQTIEDMAGQRRRKHIDLVQVRDSLSLNDKNLSDPVNLMYLAIGGQAESLRKLYQQYEWYSVKETNYSGKPVWLLLGRLSDIPPAVRAHAPTDIALQNAARSGLLPTDVRVAIGKGGDGVSLPYWLYQVEHRRESSRNAAGDARVRLVTEWDKPAKLDAKALDPQLFEAASVNEPWEDETERYLPPAPNLAASPLPALRTASEDAATNR